MILRDYALPLIHIDKGQLKTYPNSGFLQGNAPNIKIPEMPGFPESVHLSVYENGAPGCRTPRHGGIAGTKHCPLSPA